MDQVKLYLAILKKHHFWVLCAMASLFALVCWWMGANSLAKETDTNRNTVKGSYDALKKLGSAQKPPNGKFAAGVKENNEVLKKDVLGEWQQQYEAQQQLFTWPEDLAEVPQWKPGEPIREVTRRLAKSKQVFARELDQRVFMAADYRHLPVSAEEEQAAEQPAGDDAAKPAQERPPERKAEDAPLELEGLVVWSSTHRAALHQRYNLDRQAGVPSDRSIRLAQEDMWMLENLAKVVRKTNEGAADVGAAPIKRIDALDVAQWAINDAIRDTPKFVVLGDGAGGGGPERVMGSTAPIAPAEGTSLEDEMAKLLDDELLGGRYISDQGMPLTPEEAPPYAEFNLMLVRMKLLIDQRKIPDLLVNCANAPVPIEVIRFQMADTEGGGGQSSGGGIAGGGAGGGGLHGSANNADGGPGEHQAARPTHSEPDNPDQVFAGPSDVTVEVCGLVQIFNPPNEEKLGSGGAADPTKLPTSLPTTTVKLPRTPTSSSGGLRPPR